MCWYMHQTISCIPDPTPTRTGTLSGVLPYISPFSRYLLTSLSLYLLCSDISPFSCASLTALSISIKPLLLLGMNSTLQNSFQKQNAIEILLFLQNSVHPLIKLFDFGTRLQFLLKVFLFPFNRSLHES